MLPANKSYRNDGRSNIIDHVPIKQKPNIHSHALYPRTSNSQIHIAHAKHPNHYRMSPKFPFSTLGYAPPLISAQSQSSVIGRLNKSAGSIGC